MVQAHDFDTGDPFDHRLQERLRRFDQMGPDLLEQVSSLVVRNFGQWLFGGCQQALEPDDQKIVEQVGANLLRASAPVFLLKATDPFLDGRLDFSLRFHRDRDIETVAKISRTFPKSPGLTRW